MGSLQLITPPFPAALADVIGNHGWYPSMLDLPNDSLYSGLSGLAPGVVAVRQEQAELVAALTPHYVIAVRWYWIGDYRIAKEHQEDNNNIIGFSVPLDEMSRLLDKYRVQYVIVSMGSPNLGLFRHTTTLFDEIITSETSVVFEVKR